MTDMTIRDFVLGLASLSLIILFLLLMVMVE